MNKLLNILLILTIITIPTLALAQSSYTSTPTTTTIKNPRTTVIDNTPVTTTLEGSSLADGDIQKWEVFNLQDLNNPELTSTEKTPKFNFTKDGLKKVVLTTSSGTTNYNMVVTLQKPIIYSATQILKKLVVKGSAPKNSVVLVYVFSEPKLFKTDSNSNGDFRLSVNADEIGVGNHIVTAVSASKEAVAETGFVPSVTKVVEAQINNQLTPGKVIKQAGDQPLIVAQPIASDPVKASIIPLSSWVWYVTIGLFVLIILILIWIIINHLKTTSKDYKTVKLTKKVN